MQTARSSPTWASATSRAEPSNAGIHVVDGASKPTIARTLDGAVRFRLEVGKGISMIRSLARWGLGLALATSVGCGAAATDEDLGIVQAPLEGAGGTVVPSGGSAGSGTVVDFVNGGSSNPVQDTTIEAAAPDTWQGNALNCIADGQTQERSCLMSFNVTSIPFNATVLGASLFLTILDRSNSHYELTALTRGWSGTSSTTWNKALPGSLWSIPGAKGTTDREASPFLTILPNTLGQREFAFDAVAIARLQRWVSEAPANNRGFVISRPGVSDGVAIASSESASAADRPRLRVRYQ